MLKPILDYVDVINDATEIIDIEHIERGYENFPEKLNKIGISVYKK